jgi:Zn finger protein HypA/HybF involved in hydrogenase expression
MNEDYVIECEDCGWSGRPEDLICSEEDSISCKSVAEIVFNLCPDCESSNIVDIDDVDEY